MKKWLSDNFRKNKELKDEIAIKMIIQIGIRSLKELQNSLELSGNVTNNNKKSLVLFIQKDLTEMSSKLS